MEKRFLDKLMPEAQQLVHELEAFASVEIEVR